jgi:chromosome segregation ATPase
MEPDAARTDSPMEARIARTESDGSHLREDVAEIRIDLRALRDKFDELRTELLGRVETVATELNGRIDTLAKEVYGRIDALAERQDRKIDLLRSEIHAIRVWGFALYITLAGTLLTVMARGFGWI